MKVALAQLNYHIGNFDQNTEKIKAAIATARKLNADLVVFSELSVSGYPPRDFLAFDDFIVKCLRCVDDIAAISDGIAVILGAPSFNPDKKGKHLHNSIFFIADQRVQQVRHKTLLPNYDIFDEYRYFEPNKNFETVTFRGKKIALTICEDLWNIDDSPLYVEDPMYELSKQAPDLVINIAASPFHYHQAAIRQDILARNARKYQLPLVYVNHVGAQTELIFDGGSCVLDKAGKLVLELPYFQEDIRIADLDQLAEVKHKQVASKMETIEQALIVGIQNYFYKLGFSKAVLGLSGGIDSAVTAALAVKALGPQQVSGILMPSAFSSDHSINDASQLAANLGIHSEIIGIQDLFERFGEVLAPYFSGMPFDITEENLQARIRAVLLMALSNKHGSILLNTSNKSEAAVGYGTLYGDMCGGLSVLGDVYKTDVFALARHLNRETEIIPVNSIVKPPSAELRPGQQDSDSLPPYDVLDKILFQYIEETRNPDEIIASGFDHAVVNHVLRLVNMNEYKRFQSPPILRVSPKAFGMGRRMPIVARYLG